MRIIIFISIIFLCAQSKAQDTTAWHTIAYGHRASKDTAYWISGSWIQINDSVSVQHRKSIKGVVQRREIYYKRKD